MANIVFGAYPAAQGCDIALNTWCDANCPHAREHGPLYARLDKTVDPRSKPAWRCYAASTLDGERAHRYVRGTTYCTRDPPLRKVLAKCLAAANSASSTGSTMGSVRMAVDEQGGIRPTASGSASGGEPATRVTSGGLRHSSTRLVPGSRFYDGHAGARVGIVVAHCHEEMDWLLDVQRGLREGAAPFELRLELHIYEKCNNRSEDAWTRLGWEHERRTYLANKGEECYAYLTYLNDLYLLLPDVLLFFQGDGVLGGRDFRAKALSFSRMVFNGGKYVIGDIWRSVNDHQYISIARNASECKRSSLFNCVTLRTKHSSRQFECLAQLYERHTQLQAPPFWSVYANAQFGVTRDRVTARPLSFYRNLLDEFEGPAEDECFSVDRMSLKSRPFRGTCALFEFLWPSLLGEDTALDPRRTMILRR